MKNINKLLFLLPLFFESAFAYDTKNGEKMYISAKCYECHDLSSFSTKDRKAKNYKQLFDRVEQCRYGTNADWFNADRDDVVHYLNKEFYKYDHKK